MKTIEERVAAAESYLKVVQGAPLQPNPNGSFRGQNQGTALDVLCLADVQPRAIDWIWQNWIAIGKVSVLAGDGGQGKSTILCDVTARITTGNGWPDGAPGCTPGAVIILAAEDDVADTLVPRLAAAGADMKLAFNIRAVVNQNGGRRSFSLQSDLIQLEQFMEKLEAKGIRVAAIIVDPVSSYLGKVDSHKNAEVRTVLEPLGELASRRGVAVICNNHFSKGGGSANSRIIGSVAFVNQARAAFIVTPDAQTDGRFLLMPSKMNIAPIKHGLAYRIGSATVHADDSEAILTSEIIWEPEPVKMTADQALAAHNQKGQTTEKARAEEFLRDILKDGPVPQSEVKDAAEGHGLSWATVRRAKTRLGIAANKEGMKAGWLWSLPKVLKPAEDAHVLSMSTFGGNEHLRTGEADTGGPMSDRVCAQCGGSDPTGLEFRSVGDGLALLHNECARFYPRG